MTQDELKFAAKEYLGKWVSFRSDKLKSDKELGTITFIKPTNVRTYPQPDLCKEVFLVGQSIKIDLNYQLEGLRYSKNDYVVFTPSLKAVFPTEEQITYFENIISMHNNLTEKL